MRTLSQVDLAPLTTLRVGGKAERFVEIDHEEDVPLAVRAAEAIGAPVFVLGRGSNVVVGDDGVRGTVLHMATRGLAVDRRDDHTVVDVAAGEDWDALVERAVGEGWGGIACMSGIPGLVGATPIQNVGAYGQEVRETIVGVRVFDREAGAFAEMGPSVCGFGYRASVFKRNPRWIVVGVRFRFPHDDLTAIAYPELAAALSTAKNGRAPSRIVRDTILSLRRGKGMVVDPTDAESVSAGSFFVNPVVAGAVLSRLEAGAGERPPHFASGEALWKVPAAWLVERAGFAKGWSLGRARISRKHALAIVNGGGATAREVLDAARAIHDGVRARFGVSLEPEPVLVGCAWEAPASA